MGLCMLQGTAGYGDMKQCALTRMLRCGPAYTSSSLTCCCCCCCSSCSSNRASIDSPP